MQPLRSPKIKQRLRKMPKKTKVDPDQATPSVESMQPLLEAMITLLGRLVYPPEAILKIITKWKRKDPEEYVKVYNLCDGVHTGTQIADEVHIDQSSLSEVLSDWKNLGIIYEAATRGRAIYYKRLYILEEPKKSDASKQAESQLKSQETQIGPEVKSEPVTEEKTPSAEESPKQTQV
jgi:hypothetical protein